VANPKKTEKTDPMIFRERGEGGAKAAECGVVEPSVPDAGDCGIMSRG